MSPLLKYIHPRTPKFYFMQKAMKGSPFTILDLGSGNGSPSRTRDVFPECTYHGVDLNHDYEYAEADVAAPEKFYKMDLTQLNFSEIPDGQYDYVNLTHVIEHLHNGDKVLEGIAAKLKQGGYMYIEYPGQRSTQLPSMPGSLNFYDDPTHVRIYSVKELSGLLRANGFEIISSGTRRSWFYILTIPVRAFQYKRRFGKVQGSVFWDLLGFAEYVFARKIK